MSDNEASSSKRLKRAEQRGLGSAHYMDALQCLPAGPVDPSSLGDWPDVVVFKKLFPADDPAGAKRLQRMKMATRTGVVFHCDYAGRRGPETCMKMLEASFEGYGQEKGWVLNWRASEKERVLQSCIMRGPAAQKPLHLFSDLRQRLSIEHRDALKALRPKQSLTQAEKEKAYSSMQTYLEEHDAVFTTKAPRGACLIHPDRECYWQYGGDNDAEITSRPLIVVVAGVDCTPYSKFGDRLGAAHPAMESWHVFSLGTMDDEPDIIFIENSDRMQADIVKDKFGSKYVIKFAVMRPDLLGFPVGRPRRYFALLKKSLAWCGRSGQSSQDTAEDIGRDVAALFHCRCDIDMNAIVGLDTEENTNVQKKQLAERAGIVGVDSRSLTPEMCLSECELRHYLLLQDHVRDNQLSCFVSDLSQDPHQRWRGGAFLPSLTGSSRMVSFTSGPKHDLVRFITLNELEFVHGFPIAGLSHSKYDECMATSVAGTTLTCQMKALGNGMHLACLGCFVSYILAHVVRAEDMISMAP